MDKMRIIRTEIVHSDTSALAHRRSRRLPVAVSWCTPGALARRGLTRGAGYALAALLLAGSSGILAQAPVRDRSESVTPLEGARRAADVARDNLEAAQHRQEAALARQRKADEALAAAQKEQAAARDEGAAAAAALAAARKAEADAREALARTLESGRRPAAPAAPR
ncbi:MAG: hypothetical protein JNM90_16470 [Burkholderiales bacterium]|nr:hypothetical protein [Burkholderiales bacterium]